MSGLLSWLIAGLISVAAYTVLAFYDQPWWCLAPFLLLIVLSIMVCGAAGLRGGPR